MTRDHWEIPNVVLPTQAPQQQINAYRALRTPFETRWQNRRQAYGICNCYGMAFANRRTSIPDELGDDILARILHDDRYTQRTENQALPGDLVLYRDRDHGYVHVAVLVENDRENGIPRLRAISKWGPYTGEDIHNVYEHHFRSAGWVISVEFWAERP